jgi:NADP-dependent aldehyde dehydrogenase
MEITGEHFIAGERSSIGDATFTGINPATSQPLPVEFHDATLAEIDSAITAADEDFETLQKLDGKTLAALLETIGNRIEEAGDALLERAHLETALPMARLKAERGRCINGCRIFAEIARTQSWRIPRIDAGGASSTRKVPDVRTMLVGIGPVVVFGASNFPLAISVAGTDTICALATGCPVIVKAHPAHPGTCEILASIISSSIADAGLPRGMFSMLQSNSIESSQAFVEHPSVSAVAFTGSTKGGRALFDIANSRTNPIPFYGEMGSSNPVFLLPGALAEQSESIAKGYIRSVNMGVGQFCTNPAVVLGMEGDDLESFIKVAGDQASEAEPKTMLHPGIYTAFESGRQEIESIDGISKVAQSDFETNPVANEAVCAIYASEFSVLDENPHAIEEVFGPTSTIYRCQSIEQMMKFARGLDGHLTATIHGTEQDLLDNQDLVTILQQKVGRIIFNGWPTGIEVCNAMHHGGPYPATTHSYFTSIGHQSIFRFAKPICFQDFPESALPKMLRR